MKSQHLSQRAAGWRSTAVVILPLLLLGISSGSGAQTEVAAKPTKIPQGVSTPGDSDGADVSGSSEEEQKK